MIDGPMERESSRMAARPCVPSRIAETIAREGYVFVAAPDMRALLEEAGLRQWGEFAKSWDDLGTDTYMADGGRYRRRRHGVFAVSAGGITRKPHQPHYQSRDYNPLNGGIARWFEPVSDAIAAHPALTAILEACHAVFDGLTPPALRPAAWHVEVHQFRIEARAGQEGRPTPEGMHRDGVDWVLVLLVARENVVQGTTTVYDLAKRPLGSFTLTQLFDSTFVDDHRVYHGVTPVIPAEPSQTGHRDVLVVTFRGAASGAPPGQAA
jgi:hypothetical protein